MSSGRPRILVIGPTPPPYNGMSVVTENLLHSRLAEEFEIILLDTADRRGLSNAGALDCANTWLALWHAIRFLWLLLTKMPDIVYVPISQNVLGFVRDSLFLVPCRLFRKCVVVHLHGSDFRRFYDNSPCLMKALIRYCLCRVQRVVVLGENLREMFSGFVSEDRISVVPNGIPAVKPVNGDRARDLRVVLYLGNLIKHKGFIEVLHSIPGVVKEQPNVRFVFAGDLTYRGEIAEAREFLQREGLDEYVEMPGVVLGDEKCKLLQDADVFVFPPITPEGQPLVILEAMSAGLPVISTDLGAIPETVIDGITGFIVPRENPAAIAEKILLLVRDEELRNRMSEASVRRFRELYTIDHWASRLGEVFRQAMDAC